MTVSAVAGVSLWDSVSFPRNLNTDPRARRSATAVEGTPGSVGSASVQPASARPSPIRFANDSYTPGVRSGADTSSQAQIALANNAAGLTGSNPSASLQGAALMNGIPLSLLGAVNSGSSSGMGQTQGTPSSTIDGDVLSQLDAAISAAASDGSQDSNWMDDLVSYASGLGGGTTSMGGVSGTGGAWTSDLSAIEAVIQKVTSHVSSALAAQGASPSLMSAAVNALTTSLTLNSLGAVAQQIAARTGNPNTFTVTSSVVTISANGAGTNASVAGETESFSGASSSLALVTTDAAAGVAGGGYAAGGSVGTGDETGLNANGFGYGFSISESGPGGNAFAGTTRATGNATEISSGGAGGSVTASAALGEAATVYASTGASNLAKNVANNTAMVLLSDWEASLESTATQNTQNSRDASNATTGGQSQQAQSGTRSLADFFSAAGHALFKQAVALLESLFGVGNSNVATQAANGHLVDEYA